MVNSEQKLFSSAEVLDTKNSIYTKEDDRFDGLMIRACVRYKPIYTSSGFCVAPCRAMPRDRIITFFKKKRLPGVGSEPGSSRFNLFSHFHHPTAEPQRLPDRVITYPMCVSHGIAQQGSTQKHCLCK
jgi:hypothetical protein